MSLDGSLLKALVEGRSDLSWFFVGVFLDEGKTLHELLVSFGLDAVVVLDLIISDFFLPLQVLLLHIKDLREISLLSLDTCAKVKLHA